MSGIARRENQQMTVWRSGRAVPSRREVPDSPWSGGSSLLSAARRTSPSDAMPSLQHNWPCHEYDRCRDVATHPHSHAHPKPFTLGMVRYSERLFGNHGSAQRPICEEATVAFTRESVGLAAACVVHHNAIRAKSRASVIRDESTARTCHYEARSDPRRTTPHILQPAAGTICLS